MSQPHWRRIPLGLALLALLPPTVLQAENPSLAEYGTKERLSEILTPLSDWKPFPKAGQRAEWEKLPDDVRRSLIALGEQCAETPIPSLPATLYLEFRREGNRSRYQDRWMVRRKLMNSLALAECVEGKGRFLDPLANVVWAICEESSWAFPAHIGAQRAGAGLPDTTEPIVALFSAETAASMAWVIYLLEEELKDVSPLIGPRARREIDQRILSPYLERDNFGWMGFGNRHRPNNWNPWINSNVLAASLLLEKDQQRRLDTVHKVLRCLDNFFVPYPEDGSCDEGPSYWTRAAASLFDDLDLLYRATDGQFDMFDTETVRNMGRFIYRTHITGEAYVCVGDCDARVQIPRDLVYRYGQRIGDTGMQRLATFDLSGDPLTRSERGIWSIHRPLHALFNLEELRSADTDSPPLLRDVWQGDEDMQLMVARDAEGTTEGLFVSAWGGHNAQSHNHNDVGNYIVFLDGHPVLIDVGRPTYTRQTFSSERYKIWAMQSGYHNLPTVNGFEQKAGRQFAARQTAYRQDDAAAELKLDLAAAYPRDSGIHVWKRTIRLDRGKQVSVSDSFELGGTAADVVESLMTPYEVKRVAPGQLVLTSPDKSAVSIRYEPSGLDVEVETINLEDEKLIAMWGDRLYRVLLTWEDAPKSSVCTVRVLRDD